MREGLIAADKLIRITPLPSHRQRGFFVGKTGSAAVWRIRFLKLPNFNFLFPKLYRA